MIVLSARGRGGVRQLRFLPGGDLLAATRDGFMVWDVCSGETTLEDTSPHYGLSLAPDGQSFVSYGSRNLAVYSLASRRWLDAELDNTFMPCTLWSPDGRTLMTGETFTSTNARERPTERFYRTSDWQPGEPFFARRAFSNVNDSRHGFRRHGFHRHAVVSPDGRLVVTYSEGAIHLHDLVANQFLKAIESPINYPDAGGLFTRDGSRFLVWSKFKIYAIDLDSGKVALAYPACPRAVRCAALTPDGRHLLQVSADKTVRVLDVGTGQLVKDYAWNVGKLDAVAVAPDGLLAACGGSGGKVVVWDLDL